MHCESSIVNCREVLCNALKQVLDFGLDGGKVAQLVANPDKGEVDVMVGKLREQHVFVQSVSFADEPFGAVAVDSMLESAFRYGDEYVDRGEG